MQFISPSINKVLTYNYISDELKCDSNIIDNINKTFLQCKYYDNLSNLNICRKLSIIHFNARSIPKMSILLLITFYIKNKLYDYCNN